MREAKTHAQERSRLQAALDRVNGELDEARQTRSAVEAAAAAAAQRSSALMSDWEQRDAARDADVASLRAQLADALAAGAAARADAERLQQQLDGARRDVEALTVSLADEQARGAAARAQMRELEAAQADEAESRLAGLKQVAAALQVRRVAGPLPDGRRCLGRRQI